MPNSFGIFGAGAIGCYLGGKLQAAGHDVRFLGRAELAREASVNGLTLTDCDGGRVRVPQPRFVEDVRDLADCSYVLVTVKSRDTAAAAQALGPLAGTVVSLQNGVVNADVLRTAGLRVLAGMVPFNVLRKPYATFHRGTSGSVVLERGAEAVVQALNHSGVLAHTHDDLLGVQWGKLVLNLNNAVNALAGVPLKTELSQRRYRRVLAAAMREALVVLRQCGIRPIVPTPVPARWLPALLELPDALFTRLAKAMLTIDPEARSSMWDDLERRRPTEIDALNGEVVRLAAQLGLVAPVNARLVDLIRDAESRKEGSPCIAPEALPT